MKIILLKEVEGLGNAGDVVEVKDGYARNFLLPKGVAIKGTKENLANWEEDQARLKEEEAIARERAEELKKEIEALTIEIEAKTGASGKLFGSITNQEIANELSERGINIEKKKIELEENIKETGEHIVPVRVYPELVADLKVVIKGSELEIADVVEEVEEEAEDSEESTEE